MKPIDGSDVVLLKDAFIKDFLRTGAGFLFGLEDEHNIAVGRNATARYGTRKLKEYGSVTVVSAAVTDREGIDVSTDGNGRTGRLVAPNGNNAKSANIGKDFVGMTFLQLGGDKVMCVPLLTGGAGVDVEVVSYVGDGFHYFRLWWIGLVA